MDLERILATLFSVAGVYIVIGAQDGYRLNIDLSRLKVTALANNNKMLPM